MSSRTLKMILENWNEDIAKYSDETDLPFDVETFCRQMDAELSKHAWISVDERLPHRTGFYWCSTTDGGVWLYFWNYLLAEWADENGNLLDDQSYITNWTNLPEPPK